MIALSWIVSAIVFLSELAAFAAVGYGGWHLTQVPWLQWVLGVLLVLLAISLWALAAAPRANVTNPVRWAVRGLVFAAAVVLLGVAGHTQPAVIFAVSSVIVWGLSVVLPAPTGPS